MTYDDYLGLVIITSQNLDNVRKNRVKTISRTINEHTFNFPEQHFTEQHDPFEPFAEQFGDDVGFQEYIIKAACSY